MVREFLRVTSDALILGGGGGGGGGDEIKKSPKSTLFDRYTCK